MERQINSQSNNEKKNILGLMLPDFKVYLNTAW